VKKHGITTERTRKAYCDFGCKNGKKEVEATLWDTDENGNTINLRKGTKVISCPKCGGSGSVTVPG